MVTKIKKKNGLILTDYFSIGTQIEIETDENLINAQEFINNTGIVNALSTLKNRLFGEKITHNAINVISGSEQKILESSYEGNRKEIPTKIAVNLIEESSLEDDENLQDIWSNMLANSVTGKKEVTNNFISILKELSFQEITFLNTMYDSLDNIDDIKKSGFKKSSFIDELKISEESFEMIVDNLVRLHLVYTGDGDSVTDDSYTSIHMKRALVCFTYLGKEFIKACKYK